MAEKAEAEKDIAETTESRLHHKELEKAELKEETAKSDVEKEKELEADAGKKEGDAKEISDRKEEKVAVAYVYSSSNNTMVHITDLAGNTLSRVTGGMVTKHSRLKADPTIAMFAAKKAAERARDLGITSLYIRSRAKTNSPGFGSGGHAAIKTLSKEGFRIISILDTTKVPRGGPKKKGGKRGRRV